MNNNDRLLRKKRSRVALPNQPASTLYKLMRARAFPEPLRISPGAVRWLQSEIEAWLASRPRATGDRPPPGAPRGGVYQ